MSKKSSRNHKAAPAQDAAKVADTDATVAMSPIQPPELETLPSDGDEATVALSTADLAARLAEAPPVPDDVAPPIPDNSDETATAVFDAGTIQAALAAREAAEAAAKAAAATPAAPAPAKTEPAKPAPAKTQTAAAPKQPEPAKAKPTNSKDSAKAVAAAASKDGEYPSTGVLGLDIVMRWSGEMHKARFYPLPATVTIGADGEFALPEDALGGKKLQTLIQPDNKDQFALRIDDPAMGGQLLVGDKVYQLADIRAGKTELKGPAVPLTKQTHALLEFGEFTFVLSRGAVPPPAPTSLWSKENWLLLACLAMSAVLLLVPLIAGFNSAAFRDRAKLSYSEQLDETTREIIEIAQIEEPEKKEEKVEEKAEEKAEEEAGKKDDRPAEPVLVPPADQDKKEQAKIDDALNQKTGEERREEVQKIVNEKAALATAEIDKALAADNLPGGTKLFAQAGPDGDQAAGGGGVVADFGSEPGSGSGGPLGRAGGPGGNGDTDKRVAGGLEKQGLDGKKVITDADVKDKERQKVVRVGGGAGDSDGELPKSVVAAYMNSKAGAIKACYQKGLQSNPDLAGSIKVKFLIQPSGSIAGAKMESSSLGAESVETCIMNNIKSWKFPQAKNGGGTTVSKTWSFRST